MPVNTKSKTPYKGTYTSNDQWADYGKAEIKKINSQKTPISTAQRAKYNAHLKDISTTRLGVRDEVKAANATSHRYKGKMTVTQDNRAERVSKRVSGVRVNNKPIKASRMAMAERVVKKGIKNAMPGRLGNAATGVGIALLARDAGKSIVNAGYKAITGRDFDKEPVNKMTKAGIKKIPKKAPKKTAASYAMAI